MREQADEKKATEHEASPRQLRIQWRQERKDKRRADRTEGRKICRYCGYKQKKHRPDPGGVGRRGIKEPMGHPFRATGDVRKINVRWLDER